MNTRLNPRLVEIRNCIYWRDKRLLFCGDIIIYPYPNCGDSLVKSPLKLWDRFVITFHCYADVITYLCLNRQLVYVICAG